MASHEAVENDKVLDKEKVSKNEITLLLKELPIIDELFEVHYKIGEGTFSSVYLATCKNQQNSRNFAIKHIIPTYPPERIELELQCLQEIGGADNVVGVELCVRNGPSVAFVMPYMGHNKFSDYVGSMDKIELKYYMRNLLIALRKVHLFNIIHRDVKPSNFLYDRRTKKYLLVDFGLAQHFRKEDNPDEGNTSLTDTLSTKRKLMDENNHKSPSLMSLKNSGADNKCGCFGKPKICSICVVKPSQVASRAGTPGYRPPEVLLKYQYQTPAIDVWASGIIMLCILSATQPFFRCPDDCTALAEIISVFGSAKLQQCARKLGNKLASPLLQFQLLLELISSSLKNLWTYILNFMSLFISFFINLIFIFTSGKKLVCSENTPGIDLTNLCQKLRNRSIHSKSNNSSSRKTIIPEQYPPEAYDLLSKLLDVNYKTRITANDALEHAFLKI